MKTSPAHQFTALELTEDEIREITRLKQRAAQVRFFKRLGVTVDVINGRLLINRERYIRERGGHSVTPAAAGNDEPRWGVH